MLRRAIPVAALALLARPAAAHDFWIEPSTFRPSVGDQVSAALRVGQKLVGDALPRIPQLIERFEIKGAGAALPLDGPIGGDPAGAARVVEAGLHWIGYQSRPYSVTLDARTFEEYLREEGLERIVDERARRGQSAAPGRERFYRCAKALLDARGKKPAPRSPAVFEAPLGFTLELIPRKNPYALRPGAELLLALTFRGQPDPGMRVVAIRRGDPDSAVTTRTDGRGLASLRLAGPGFWLVKAVHMEAAPAGAGVDWESYWASLTFDLAAGP